MSVASTPVQSTTVRTNVETSAYESLTKHLIHDVTKDWGWLLAAGILSVAGGTAALLAPGLATGIAGIFIASALFVVGCFNLVGTCFVEKGHRLESSLTGVIQVLLASVMAFYPFATLMSLTILIAGFMLADGIFRIALAFQTRDLPGWGWTMAGGFAGVATSVIVMVAMPQASFWVIGILVGVNLISVGAARIAVAMAGRKIAKATE